MQPAGAADNGVAAELVAKQRYGVGDLAEGEALGEQVFQRHVEHRIVRPARMRGLWRKGIHGNFPQLGKPGAERAGCYAIYPPLVGSVSSMPQSEAGAMRPCLRSSQSITRKVRAGNLFVAFQFQAAR